MLFPVEGLYIVLTIFGIQLLRCIVKEDVVFLFAHNIGLLVAFGQKGPGGINVTCMVDIYDFGERICLQAQSFGH